MYQNFVLLYSLQTLLMFESGILAGFEFCLAYSYNLGKIS